MKPESFPKSLVVMGSGAIGMEFDELVWRVLESHLSFVAEHGAWDGTDVVFEIADKGGKTELRFTHVGLTPDVECYDACRKGWTHYVRESLKRRIETGKGAPES